MLALAGVQAGDRQTIFSLASAFAVLGPLRRLERRRPAESRTPHSLSTYNFTTMQRRRGWWTAVLRDVQFWVPLIVLLIGLLLLRMAR
jgi:hypothetical protein